MHLVAFIVYPGFELLDTSGPASVFNTANHILSHGGKRPLYGIDLVSAQGGSVTSSSGIIVQTRRLRMLSRKTIGTLLVAGAEREALLSAMADPTIREWLPRLTGNMPRFGSVCSGAFILASLGLLDGHRAATHWDACTPFSRAFPSVKSIPKRSMSWTGAAGPQPG